MRLILFGLLLLAAVTRVFHVLSWKDTMGPYLSNVQQLYATEENRMDVLFVGSSHCYGGINPDVLWEQHGIASFDLACSGQDRISAVYYLKEALKTQRPKAVFVDVYAASFDRGAVQGNVYRNLISMKLSRNSAELVNDYQESPDMDYILRWPIVHTRYNELGRFDFVQNPYSEYGRGFCSRYSITPLEPTESVYFTQDEIPVSDANREFVDRLYALSQEYGFDLVLMLIPYQVSTEEQMVYNGVFSYAESLGITCFDFNRMGRELKLEYTQDFMNAGHLNIFGAGKMSTWLGEYLVSHYDIADHRGDPAYEQWDRSLAYQQHLALQEFMPMAGDLVSCVSAIGATPDVITVLTLGGDYRNSSEMIPYALRVLQAPETFYETGGTCIVQNGEVLAWLPSPLAYESGLSSSKTAGRDADDSEDIQDAGHGGRQRSVSCDLDRFHTIHAEDTGDGYQRILLDGKELMSNVDGLGIYVYDPVIPADLRTKFFY